MAHELDFTTGRAAIALRGGANSAWHGFGQSIEPGDTLEQIAAKAGLEWTAHKAPVMYTPTEYLDVARSFDNLSVIYRSDSGEPLGTVSENRYNIVQPLEILEFFRDFLRDNGLSIETAGALRGGRIVWCLANLGPDFRYVAPGNPQDVTQSYVRLQTSYDGTRVTSLVATSVRQVCANTEALIEARHKRDQYRVAHSSQFDARSLQSAFGLLGEQHRITADLWNALQQRRVTDAEAREFFCRVSGIEPEDLTRTKPDGSQVVSTKARNGLNALALAYKRGPGATLPSANGTAYGLLNAVTYYADHLATVRDTHKDGTDTARLTSAWLGTGAKMKDRARQYAAEMAGVALAA